MSAPIAPPDTDPVLDPRWADDWPDTITLGQAARLIGFDTFEGMDRDMVLAKREVVAAEHYTYSTAYLDDNDAEDRTGRLHDGFLMNPEHVPPVVILPGRWGLLDGNHRVAIAHEAGRELVPAYMPLTEGSN